MRNTVDVDEGTVEALLAGPAGEGVVPGELARVAALLQDARVDAAAGALSGESATVAAMRAALTGRPVGVDRRRPARLLGRVLTVKAAVVSGTVVFGAGAAAAATGNLPAPVQSAAHDVLATIGIRVPGAAGAAVHLHRGQARPGHEGRSGGAGPSSLTLAPSGTPSGPAAPPPQPGASGTDDHGTPSVDGTSTANFVRDRGAHGRRRDDADPPGEGADTGSGRGHGSPGSSASGDATHGTVVHPRP